MWILVSLLFSVTPQPSLSWDPCSVPPEVQVNPIQPISFDPFMESIIKMKLDNADTPIAYNDTESMKETLRGIFDHTKPTSKLNQFFTTLYILADHMPLGSRRHHALDVDSTRKALILGGMFPNDEFPKKIRAVSVKPILVNGMRQYEFVIEYADEKVTLPLNSGRGFGVRDHGKCQHAQALIFYKTFSFRTKRLPNDNVAAFMFKNVDLFGDFGSRGVVDVDIQYVTLDQIEFFTNSPKGRVKTYVSRNEFERNKHHWILKLISKVLPDNSVQVLDW